MSDELIELFKSECEATIDAFTRDLKKIRTGRASSGLVDGVVVDYYGSKTALSHLGQVSTPEANLILIKLFDEGSAPAVEKAILESDLGFNPSREGSSIRIIVPPLSEERRREMVKLLGKMAEDKRVSIRNHRRDANDELKSMEKEGEASKDDVKRYQDSVQEVTNSYVKKIDELLASKEKEVMQV